ncbi:MerR family transcriptional regulator [Chloroflexota bacterium]
MSLKVIDNRPLYPIGIVAGLLEIHPQTIRVWERYGAVQPKRISGKRWAPTLSRNRN